MNRRQRNLLKLVGALAGAASVQACYYQALNLENPSDYYYRYCYAGVSCDSIPVGSKSLITQCTAIQAAQPDYTACCTPLPAGATAPATCGQLSKSHEQAGTTCQWGAVPTTDFPQQYNYAPSTQGGNNQKSTVWVTSTTTTACAQGASSPYVPSAPVSSLSSSKFPDVSPVYASSPPYVHEDTSSGKLAQATSSPPAPPPPAPSSSPCKSNPTYVHQEPSSSPPPCPPVSSSKQAEYTSSPPPVSPTTWTPPCIPSQQGLIYGTYVPCSGSSCPHVGCAVSTLQSGKCGTDVAVPHHHLAFWAILRSATDHLKLDHAPMLGEDPHPCSMMREIRV